MEWKEIFSSWGGIVAEDGAHRYGNQYVTLASGQCRNNRRVGRRKTYSGDYKARVVLECLRGKKSLQSLAEEYDVHPNQIKNWKSYFLKQAASIFEDKRKKRNHG